MDIPDLFALDTRVDDKLVTRGDTIGVAESSARGLISAALLSRAGASVYYFGGAVLYTRRSFRRLTSLTSADTVGMRSSSSHYAQLLAQTPANTISYELGLGGNRRRRADRQHLWRPGRPHLPDSPSQG